MGNDPLRVILDSNILISAYVFGGKPESILRLVITEKIQAVISQNIITEFVGVLRKKFGVTQAEIIEIQNEIEESFETVYPSKTFHIIQDEDDNRVLEAAVEGKCGYIITRDQDLLDLKIFKKISIITPNQFLKDVLKR